MRFNKFRHIASPLGIVVFLIALAAINRYFDLYGAFLRLQGEECVISPSKIDLGDCVPDAMMETKTRVRNLLDKPVVIESATSTCGCVSPQKLPLTIEPRQSVDLRIDAHIQRSGARYDQTISIMVNSGDRLRFHNIRVVANILEP